MRTPSSSGSRPPTSLDCRTKLTAWRRRIRKTQTRTLCCPTRPATPEGMSSSPTMASSRWSPSRSRAPSSHRSSFYNSRNLLNTVYSIIRRSSTTTYSTTTSAGSTSASRRSLSQARAPTPSPRRTDRTRYSASSSSRATSRPSRTSCSSERPTLCDCATSTEPARAYRRTW